jgi:lipoic acid synthetase
MVGLGETKDEVLSVMDDMRASNIDVMTIGQYLRPSERQLPVRSFITPDEFKEYEEEGLKRGFKFVESGPFVRSSYHAWRHTADLPKRPSSLNG